MDAEDTWIRLEGLLESTEYNVTLLSVLDGERSAVTHAVFTTGQCSSMTLGIHHSSNICLYYRAVNSVVRDIP